jgi:hypothetical protein
MRTLCYNLSNGVHFHGVEIAESDVITSNWITKFQGAHVQTIQSA